MLVVRPKPQPSESLMGYVLRLTEVNGYPTTSYVLHAMSGKWYKSKPGRLESDALIELAGLSEDEANRLSLRSPTSSKSIFIVAGSELTSNDFISGRSRICPECLASGGFCDAFWDISHARACAFHGVWLIDACPTCGTALTWARSKVGECRCGCSLADIAPSSAPEAIVRLMQVLRSAIFRDQAIAPFPEGMEHLRELNIGHLCKLIWVMSDSLHLKENSERSVRVVRSREKLASYLPVIAEALFDWPRGFYRFLDRTYTDDLISAEVLPSFRSRFNWALVRLGKNTKGGSNVYRFLIQEIYSYAAKFWPRSQLIAFENRHGWVNLPARLRWGTFPELAAELGVDGRTLMRDLASMNVPSRKTANTRNRLQAVYDLDWARSQLPKSRSRPLGVRQAARILGMSNGVLHVLRSRGVIGSEYRTQRNGVFSKEDIESFRTRVRDAVATSPKRTIKKLSTIDRLARTLDLSPEQKADVYQAILDGRLQVRGGASRSPEQFQLDREEVELVLGGLAEQRSHFISFAEARELLECVDAVTRGLIVAGYLDVSKSKGRRRILRRSIDEFEKEYTMAKKIAKKHDTWPRSVTTLARSHGIPYIEIPCDQHSAILFTNEDADKVSSIISRSLAPACR